MSAIATTAFTEYSVDELDIEEESMFAHVALYADLKQVLRDADYKFRVLPSSSAEGWDRAQLLNLTFWGLDGGGDVLIDASPPADVIAHAAWHFLANRALNGGSGAPASAAAMFIGEAIASAFDVYLIGRLLGHSPDASFLETQIPAMADAADAAGLAADEFEELLNSMAADPELAFSDLRSLLCDATEALFACETPEAAIDVLDRLDSHRFGALLHHYELSNWVLYARAYATTSADDSARAKEVDSALRTAPVAID